MARAYFITFSTYGTWLHGTAKGQGSVDRKTNAFGAAYVAPKPSWEQEAVERMIEPHYVLNAQARNVVRDAMVDLCKEKGWTLLALHVRTNHVHVVVTADREPGRLMSDLKGRASRELNRLEVDSQSKRWTRHGSTRHLFDDASVEAAIAYTLDEQGQRMAVYDPRNEPTQ